MTLTVPTAGVIAGRAPQGVQVAVPELGANLNALGQKMGEIATRWKDQDRELQAQRTTLDMTREFALARQEVDQLSDPAAMGPAWDQHTAAIRAKYLPADGKLDPKLEAQLGLNFTELSDRNNLAVGDRMIALRQSAQTAGWVGLSSQIAAEAVTADPTNFQAMVDLGHNAIEGRLANGIIDPAAAATERLGFDKDVYGARAAGLIDSDPAGFLAAVEAGEFTELGDSLKVYSGAAKNAVAQQATAAASAQKQANAATVRRLGSMTDLFRDGRKVEDVAYLNDAGVVEQAAKDTELNDARNEALAAQDLADEMPVIRTMTLPQIDAAIAVEKKRPVDSARPWEAKRLGVLLGWREDAAKWQTDGIATSRAAGLPVPVLPNFDPSRPDDFATGLAGRMGFGIGLKETGLTAGQPILDNNEKAALQPVIKPDAEVAPKLALAAATVAGGGDDWQRAAQAMDASPELRGAMRVLSETGDKALAESVLRGQQKKALSTETLPADKDVRAIVNELTGGTFDKDPATLDEISASAMAVYVDESAAANPDGTLDEDAMLKALSRVMGATPDQNGDLTVGGLQEVHGAPIMLPAGTPASSAALALDQVEYQLEGYAIDPATGQASSAGDNPDIYRALRAASIGGKSTPDFSGNPLKWWPQAQLAPAPGQPKGTYILQVVIDGRAQPVPSVEYPTQPYTFRLTDLMREAGQ